MPYDRLAIYERDGGRCHICREAVSVKEMTLDHLIPISLGGDDRPENVALAHRACNSRRGVARFPTQLRLVG